MKIMMKDIWVQIEANERDSEKGRERENWARKSIEDAALSQNSITSICEIRHEN